LMGQGEALAAAERVDVDIEPLRLGKPAKRGRVDGFGSASRNGNRGWFQSLLKTEVGEGVVGDQFVAQEGGRNFFVLA